MNKLLKCEKLMVESRKEWYNNKNERFMIAERMRMYEQI